MSPISVSVSQGSPINATIQRTSIDATINRTEIQQQISDEPEITTSISAAGPQGPPGPPGPPGPQGSAGVGAQPQVFVQTTPNTTWVITHNLGRYPLGLQVFDGNDVRRDLVEMDEVDVNTTLIRFLTPTSGKAVYS
jgi:hypothetical protein